MIFMSRYTGLIILFLLMIFVLMMILMMMMFYCSTAPIKIHSRHARAQTMQAAMRNATIMNMIRRVPYSQFMLQEARDCPICLL